jgi:error-prone DNA polymerase
MLSAIRKAFDLIAGYRGQCWTMASIPAEDPAVYAMISRADTVGVFQIESRAQMTMLPRLRPRTFYDLVIEVAIIRPGPIQGHMVHPYLRRREAREEVTYPSEEVRAVLSRTLGVPLFQEQVIKLAMVAAGFSGGEADGLRRAMAAWHRKGGLEVFERRLIDGMRGRGYSEAYARRIYDQILGFGEYGFPESHAASFALIAHVSAWLKCHEPAAFLCALLNSQPMGFYAPSQLVQDAQRHGLEVRAVDVSESGFDCTLEWGAFGEPAVRLGLRMVKGLTRAGAEGLVSAREAAPFESVLDVARRAGLSRRDLECLAAAGALQELAGHRRRARWAVLGVETPLPVLLQALIPEAVPLLPRPTVGEDLVADYASLGLTLGPHPLALLRPQLNRRGLLTAARLRDLPHGSSARTTGLVITRQRPASASGVVFLTLEDETGHTHVIVWRRLAERQRSILLGSRLLGVVGEVQREGEVLHLVARRLTDHSALLGRLTVRARDFH